ncbi:MAG: hypothetical protein QOH06_4433 [Acidobacteriota bacterium]|jgi:hypothetical protein|nr:hypothetical protein [Acidobacteriota bacterium]
MKLSREGITLFDGVIAAFAGKIINPPALQIAQMEGLVMKWDYEEPDKVLALHLRIGGTVSDPILRIPLTEDEVELIEGYREKGGWGYYELKAEEDDDRAAVHVSFMNASNTPVSLLWIVDRNHRTRLRDAMDDFAGEGESLFDD